jgi:hypothetical protein
MQLGQIDHRPSDVLDCLIKVRRLMEMRSEETTPTQVKVIDSLIDHVVTYIDEQEYQASAIAAARIVANTFMRHGGEAAREALGVPSPSPALVESLRSGPGGSDALADSLHKVALEVHDDAACLGTPAGYWVSAWIFLPVAHPAN